MDDVTRDYSEYTRMTFYRLLGSSWEDIARVFHRSLETCRLRASHWDEAPPLRLPPKKARKYAWTPAQDSEILRLREEGYTWYAISRVVHAGEQSVRKRWLALIKNEQQEKK